MGSVGCTTETTSTFQPWREGKYTQWLGKINDLPRLRMGFCKKDAVLIATHHLYHLDDSSKFFPTCYTTWFRCFFLKSSMQTKAYFRSVIPISNLKKKGPLYVIFRVSKAFTLLQLPWKFTFFFNQNNSSIKSLFFLATLIPLEWCLKLIVFSTIAMKLWNIKRCILPPPLFWGFSFLGSTPLLTTFFRLSCEEEIPHPGGMAIDPTHNPYPQKKDYSLEGLTAVSPWK